MYIPAVFNEARVPVLHDFIRRHDFATIVTAGGHGLIASHVPVVLIPDHGELSALQFHLARQPLVDTHDETGERPEPGEVLVAEHQLQPLAAGPHRPVGPLVRRPIRVEQCLVKL